MTDDGHTNLVITKRRRLRRLPRSLAALVPADPALVAVLRLTAAALVVTILFWVFR